MRLTVKDQCVGDKRQPDSEQKYWALYNCNLHFTHGQPGVANEETNAMSKGGKTTIIFTRGTICGEDLRRGKGAVFQ